MNIPGIHEILMWLVIIALVVLVAMSGMCLNRMYIHRAHRKALAELQPPGDGGTLRRGTLSRDGA